MLFRPRPILLGWAALCFGLFALVGLVVGVEWGPLVALDNRGQPAQAWAVEEDWAVSVLRFVEVATNTRSMTIYTVLLAVVLLVRKLPRAAYFTAGVMLATGLTTTATKTLFGRARPDWQHPEWLLDNAAYPSGHASGIAAFAGVVVILAAMFVRRSAVRRSIAVVAWLVALVVCLDRVLLGRHYPTDVVGGVLLGVGMVLLGVALLDPNPRPHAETAEPLVEAVSSPTRDLAVIVNPVKVEDVGQFRSIVASMAQEAGWSAPRWHYTTIEDPGTGMAARASVDGADLVLVCGGDGTVREVCAELAGTGIPVGIIPAGTGNLLARNLDIPLYLRSAIDVALNGQDRAIDLVEVSGDGLADSSFLVMAGMGLDAAIMEGVNEDIKRRVGWFAYVISGLRSMMVPAVRFEVSVDGGEFTRHRARTVVVGNVGYLQAGMPLLPDAAIDDGRLDVVLLHPERFWSWIPLLFRVLARHKRTDDTLQRMTGASVVLRAAHDTPRQLDGDSVGPGRELRMQCLHGRLLVRVPR